MTHTEMCQKGSGGGISSEFNTPTSIDFDAGEIKLKLGISDQVFKLTLTTKLVAGCLPQMSEADVVDLGCGVGALGIFAAKKGARSVTCLDVMPDACCVARSNALLNGVDGQPQVVVSDLFEAVNGRQFDVIIDDVSGIADEVARISSWYPASIPTGGRDGTVQVIRMLQSVMGHLKPGGKLYLPIASLSCLPKTVKRAQELFGGNLELVLDRMIPFSPELYRNRDRLEQLREEGIIDFSVKNSRCPWNLKVFVGTKV